MLREDEINKRYPSYRLVAGWLEQYRAQITKDSYFDFSAILEITVEELSKSKRLRKQISHCIKYVVVDEYQDVNPIQEKLIRLLHGLGAGLCVVGDDDQTIYQWRGSSIENIRTFQGRYPAVKQIRLQENFRSSRGVIETASDFIARVPSRLPKAMKFEDAQRYEPGDVVALAFDSPEQEAGYIAETTKSLRGVAFNDGSGRRGLSWSDMAILLRSVKHNGSVIAQALKDAGIPFIVTGLTNLFETKEVRAARDLFHFIAGKNIWINKTEQEPPTAKELRQSWENSELGLTKPQLTRALRYIKRIRDNLHAENESRLPSIQEIFLKFLERTEIREEDVPDDRGQVVFFNLGRFSEIISDWETIHFASKPMYRFYGFAKFLYYTMKPRILIVKGRKTVTTSSLMQYR